MAMCCDELKREKDLIYEKFKEIVEENQKLKGLLNLSDNNESIVQEIPGRAERAFSEKMMRLSKYREMEEKQLIDFENDEEIESVSGEEESLECKKYEKIY